MSTKLGTIVALQGQVNQIGIVINTDNLPVLGIATPHVSIYMGDNQIIRICEWHVDVINTNYSVDGNSSIYQYESIFNEFKAQFDKIGEFYQKKVTEYTDKATKAFNAQLVDIKPKDDKKTFLFSSHYTPKGLLITVSKKFNEYNPKMLFNGVELTSKEKLILRNLVENTFAGLQIANTTLKIGETIGDTQTIRDAFAYNDSLKK